ncbi:hypothetical protein [Paenibacillus sp. ov031]|uniref:hypothetical protein n=1 Tax=Paenibacillus sp. ov031 TaxID=1761879 RepID=UPI001BA7A40A|nr:hypothetical protein [Paenibacillus sp. ov031]
MSYSYLLDNEPRIRTFQNKDVIDYVSGSSKLGALTLQYRETDWQFHRRLKSSKIL